MIGRRSPLTSSLDTVLKRFASPDEMREFTKGRAFDLTAGTVFSIPPEPHDSWVVGSEPYVSLHLLGADHYAR